MHYALCPQCDWVVHYRTPAPGERICCSRCNHHLADGPTRAAADTPAWALAALITLALSFGFDFLGFETRGISHTMAFADAMTGLTGDGYPALAFIFILTTAVLPALFLGGTLYLMLATRMSQPLPRAIRVARLIHAVRMWMMSDVFVIGILVSLIKIVTLADIHIGPAFLLFCAFSLLLLKTLNSLDWPALWDAIAGPADKPAGLQTGTTGASQGLTSCNTCGALLPVHGSHRCRRCGHRHWLYHVSRMQLTWALLATSVLLYIPANIYPIMTTQTLTGSARQTIAGGVLHLIETGSWPIALVIFAASIVVPLTKIVALSWLCLCGHYGWHRNSLAHMRLYRITAFIGRWSMIDVFVVAILIALVQAGALMSVQPGPAAVAFAGVVIVTMLAAESFDPRVLWRNA